MQQLKYDNIAISGGIGVGTTTLMYNLLPFLSPLGFKAKSTGEFFRNYTKENIDPSATLWNDQMDRDVDGDVKKLFEKSKKWIIEGWLAGFMSRNITSALRVLLICSNEGVVFQRVAKRDGLTLNEAKKYTQEREKRNLAKWRRIYGNYDFFDTKYYTIVIDTATSSESATVDAVLKVSGFKKT